MTKVIAAAVKALTDGSRTQVSSCERTALLEVLAWKNADHDLQCEFLKILLDAGIDPNIGSGSNNPLIKSILYHSGSEADNRTIAILLEAGASVGAGDQPGDNAFLLAASHGNIEVAKTIMHYWQPCQWTIGKMREIAQEWECNDFILWLNGITLRHPAEADVHRQRDADDNPAKRCKLDPEQEPERESGCAADEAQGPCCDADPSSQSSASLTGVAESAPDL